MEREITAAAAAIPSDLKPNSQPAPARSPDLGLEHPFGPGEAADAEASPIPAVRLCDGILAAVGNTPLVRLRRYLPDAPFRLYAKVEALNPAGSIKDRPAVAILEHAIRKGRVHRKSVIIESSSGNMGIGLAQACRFHHLRFICVVDPKATAANLEVMRAYGAEVELVSQPDPATGEFLQARLNRVQQLVGEIESSFWPNQYANSRNSASHYHTTMHELSVALDGAVDYVFVPTSTCGTVRGCCEYVRDRDLSTKVIAVDAFGSLIFSDIKGQRIIPGLGASLRPPLCPPDLIHDCIHVSDLDCVVGCRRLVDREAILAGGSSGGVLAAIGAYRDRIPADSNVVAILPDRGERYLATLFSDEWVHKYFGNVENLWKAPREIDEP